MLKQINLISLLLILGLGSCTQINTNGQVTATTTFPVPGGRTQVPATSTVTNPPTPTPKNTQPVPTMVPPQSSGIEGQVTQGPMCPGPIQIGSTSCPDQPYQATITVLGTNNSPVVQFQTNLDGTFRIALAPGTYIIHPESNNRLPVAADQTVTVVEGQLTQVSIVYDTGMR